MRRGASLLLLALVIVLLGTVWSVFQVFNSIGRLL